MSLSLPSLFLTCTCAHTYVCIWSVLYPGFSFRPHLLYINLKAKMYFFLIIKNGKRAFWCFYYYYYYMFSCVLLVIITWNNENLKNNWKIFKLKGECMERVADILSCVSWSGPIGYLLYKNLHQMKISYAWLLHMKLILCVCVIWGSALEIPYPFRTPEKTQEVLVAFCGVPCHSAAPSLPQT